MASLETRNERFRIVFRFNGKKYQVPLRTTEEREAAGCLARLEENLRLVERGRLPLPQNADLGVFLLSDGSLTNRPQIAPSLTLAELCDKYEQVHSNGALEANSLETVKLHMRHFKKSLGVGFEVTRLTVTDLQSHITRRAKKKGIHKRPLSSVTLERELSSFRLIWNWAMRCGLLREPFPYKGLVFPKTEQKPPFQTFDEIACKASRGDKSISEQRLLWDCLFLSVSQVNEVLQHARTRAIQPFIYPMMVFAAHTGARRSEILRCQVSDVDFSNMTVLIREKKKIKHQRSFRRIPLTPFLASVLKTWLIQHPGGVELFSQPPKVIRSRSKRKVACPISRNEANDHFHRAIEGSKWSGKLRGWHVFRHSFASNAAKTVDQRTIDSWMGHQTEEMRNRYRHLFPEQQQAAIQTVFGHAVLQIGA